MSERRQKVLFVCGSLNQTTQMHQIARELPGMRARVHAVLLRRAARVGAARRARGVHRRRAQARAPLPRLPARARACPSTSGAGAGRTTSSSTARTSSCRASCAARRVVLVQEGILDPEGWEYRLWRRLPFLPRWMAGTCHHRHEPRLRTLLRGERGLPRPLRRPRRAGGEGRGHRHPQLRRLPGATSTTTSRTAATCSSARPTRARRASATTAAAFLRWCVRRRRRPAARLQAAPQRERGARDRRDPLRRAGRPRLRGRQAPST